MGITNANKELSRTEINCGESFQVTLSLAAQPDITSNPTDIVLILDRSGSMAGSPLANLKAVQKNLSILLTKLQTAVRTDRLEAEATLALSALPALPQRIHN